MIRRFLFRTLILVLLSAPLLPVYGFVAHRHRKNVVVSPRSLAGDGFFPSTNTSPSPRRVNPKQFLSAAATINPTKASSTRTTGRKRLAACMAFLTGFANVAIFTKFKTFATMLTGNTMWMALSVTERNYADAAYYLSVIASYLLGTAVFRRTDLSLRKQTLPVCAIVVSALFILGDWVHFATNMARWLPMVLFSAAYGIINSLGTEVSGTLTFVITGHVTRLVNQLVDRLSRTAGRNKLTEAQKTAVILNAAIYGGFCGGAVFATLLASSGLLNRFGILSAVGVSHAALWLFHDMEALGGAWWLRKDEEMCDLDDDGEPCEIDDKETESTQGK